jgi:tRNA (guanine10-N2)-dimethyltransferase
MILPVHISCSTGISSLKTDNFVMKLLFELSGENPTLPRAELECVATVLDGRMQVAVAECPNPDAAHRLAMTHIVLKYLGECAPDIHSFRQLLQELAIETSRPFSGRVKKVHTGYHFRDACSQRDFERLIGTMITGPVRLRNPEVEFRAILSEDRCYFGRVLYRINRGSYNERNPGRRDFFHPGVMMPRMARTLVNLSCAGSRDCLLDPFCGTGGILIEADALGIRVIGSDADPVMIAGCRENISQSSLIIADATRLPFSDFRVDAIVTDFPYGQSVCIRKTDTMEQLYHNTLLEISRVLRPGCRAVVVTHRNIAGIANEYLKIVQRHTQRVHKSLTRQILVLRKRS